MNLNKFRKQIGEICRQNDITMLGVFGSTARGEDTPDSDIDLLVRFGAPKSLLELIRLEDKLVETFGKEIDLVTEGFLHPRIKENALRDLKVLYESA